MGRKANPDASYLDIEKAFYKNGGKIVRVKEVPFEGSKRGKSSTKLDDIGLVRPVPAKGMEFRTDDGKPALEIKKPVRKENSEGGVRKSSVPNVILRKPTVFKDDGDEDTLVARLRMRPNLSLKMGDEQVKDKFSDMTLLRKPEPLVAKNTGTVEVSVSSVDDQGNNEGEFKTMNEEPSDEFCGFTLLERPQKSTGEKKEEKFGEVNDMVPIDVGGEKEEEQFGEVNDMVPNDVGANLCSNI